MKKDHEWYMMDMSEKKAIEKSVSLLKRYEMRCHMQFKHGDGWKAGYDEERNIYAGLIYGFGSFLYEINKNLWDQLEDGMGNEATSLISKGRRLYMDVNDRCGPPYTIVFDEDYKKLVPWADVTASGQLWPTEMTDAVVEVLESEKDNREQRRKKRKAREEENGTDKKT